MIKSELINIIARKNDLSSHDADIIVSTVFDEIKKALAEGNRVELRGFGVLSVRHRKPRLSRNPKTGDPVQVAEKKVPFFKAGKTLIDTLNQK